MTFVDANVFMYAVGRSHALRADAQAFLAESQLPGREPLCTSADVLQELLHAYLSVGRTETLDNALRLARSTVAEVLTIDEQDAPLARESHPRPSRRYDEVPDPPQGLALDEVDFRRWARRRFRLAA